ncbi:MAG: DUF4234 domain-containing protein [Myxococcales bacterium]|nr:DUF4234 domain-containing protein [Myxococcales bacterium]MCB9520278.1 DUF4234 domain-containing protein [Myxococcales bacterium]MCB9531354.1 DUF4234 domain-containing protein [Myxococcales bacterium]MCB9533573.1 DUF4234 domain-containing protein [Myxococcales bacterium]
MLAGKPRSFGVGLLLCFVTFGIYVPFWHYAAFRELYDQERDPRFPTGLFVLGLLPLVSLVGQPLYMAECLRYLNEIRRRQGLAPTMEIGEFLLWYILGSFVIVGPLIAYSRIQNALNETWGAYARLEGAPVLSSLPALPPGPPPGWAG